LMPDSEHPYGIALPPIILQLLRIALKQPLVTGYGYYERTMNLNEVLLQKLSEAYEHMDQLVMMPTPLLYIQGCKILLCMYLVVAPMSIDNAAGVWGNVVLPVFLGVTFYGFEIVAEKMENPIGDDTSDLNLLELIHSLEVEAKHIFNLSERDAPALAKSWHTLGAKFDLVKPAQNTEAEFSTRRTYDFDDFFKWVPFPDHQLKYMLLRGSDAWTVNKAMFINTWRCCFKCCKMRNKKNVQKNTEKLASL